MRSLLAVAALLLAGCAASSSPPAPAFQDQAAAYTVPAVPDVPPEPLLADHADFVHAFHDRTRNGTQHAAARADLRERFASYGLEAHVMPFDVGDLTYGNVVGIRWGVLRDEWVVVGGHFDSADIACSGGGASGQCPVQEQVSQGAYDNGSGTMIVAHLAKAYANVTPHRTLAFVAFDGEERGLLGAEAFLDAIASRSSGFGRVEVMGMVNVDMLGLNWPGVMAPVNYLTNDEAVGSAVVAAAGTLGFPEGMLVQKDRLVLGNSDHAPFMAAGIPAVFFISGMEEYGAPAPAPPAATVPTLAYPFVHNADTVENLRLLAGDPVADQLPHPNLEAGFGSAAALVAHAVHYMACQPGTLPAVAS